jgi:hypothetical protein
MACKVTNSKHGLGKARRLQVHPQKRFRLDQRKKWRQSGKSISRARLGNDFFGGKTKPKEEVAKSKCSGLVTFWSKTAQKHGF